MKAFRLSMAPRMKRTPFTRRVEASGVTAYAVYNHMLLPSVFRSLEEDYWHLRSAVQLWDVSAQRQVEILGPDALKLLQLTTPRDLSRMKNDQCGYIPVVDDRGRLLNDPVLVRLDASRFRVSLADSDLMLFYKGLASGLGMNVSVFEPDVSPLAVQGPLANELVGSVFGDDTVKLRRFRHRRVSVAGTRMVIARSGWSRQGGFEIYLEGSENGEALWDLLFETGQDLDVRAGCPNYIERISSGLLSYGNDMTDEHTPFEAGLAKFCDLETPLCLGHRALVEQQEPSRMIRPVEILGGPVPEIRERWMVADENGNLAGSISSTVWSPEFKTNVAIGMIDRHANLPGNRIVVHAPDGKREAVIRGAFWM